MNTQKLKAKRAQRRRFRVRKPLFGTPQKPRLSVSRSNLHISAQLIDDLNGVTIASATSAGKSSGLKHGANVAAAKVVGKKLAEAAKAKGISSAAFDRGQFRFHGRIAALAVAATEAGLVCTSLESMKAKQKAAAEAPAEKGEKGKGEKKGGDKPKGEGKPKAEGGGQPKAEGGEKPKGEGKPKPESGEAPKKEKKPEGGEKK
jgi:large subunit ribosomal protein L18